MRGSGCLAVAKAGVLSMDFSLTEEQRDVQELARKIFTDLASVEHQKRLDASGYRFDAGLWQQLAQSGLLGLAINTEFPMGTRDDRASIGRRC